jgi:hypothetical protein
VRASRKIMARRYHERAPLATLGRGTLSFPGNEGLNFSEVRLVGDADGGRGEPRVHFINQFRPLFPDKPLKR